MLATKLSVVPVREKCMKLYCAPVIETATKSLPTGTTAFSELASPRNVTNGFCPLASTTHTPFDPDATMVPSCSTKIRRAITGPFSGGDTGVGHDASNTG